MGQCVYVLEDGSSQHGKEKKKQRDLYPDGNGETREGAAMLGSYPPQ